MTSPIRTERHDNVLVIISDNPPVNALGQAVRAGLVDGIAEALSDDLGEVVHNFDLGPPLLPVESSGREDGIEVAGRPTGLGPFAAWLGLASGF